MIDLKTEREKAGLTQEALGDKVGVTRKAVSHYERGRRRPSPETAQRIGAALRIDWTRFFVDGG